MKPIALLLLFLAGPGLAAQPVAVSERHPGPGLHAHELAVDGAKRTYLVHVPLRYVGGTSTPLLVLLHGGGGTAQAAMRETGWTEKADKEGFLVAIPNAMARDPSRRSSFAFNPQLWNDGSDRFYPGQQAPDDVRFLEAMLDDLSARFSVQPGQVFFTGFSNGASMTFRAAAALPHRIAAIAPVAGAYWMEPVKLQAPVSMCYITGTADPLNPIEGGVPKLASGGSDRVRGKPKPPVRESILKWVRALGCADAPASVSEEPGLRTETYCAESGGPRAVYIAVEGLGHAWPGGRSLLPESMVGRSSDRIRATDVIWDFFRNHARAATVQGR